MVIKKLRFASLLNRGYFAIDERSFPSPCVISLSKKNQYFAIFVCTRYDSDVGSVWVGPPNKYKEATVCLATDSGILCHRQKKPPIPVCDFTEQNGPVLCDIRLHQIPFRFGIGLGRTSEWL